MAAARIVTAMVVLVVVASASARPCRLDTVTVALCPGTGVPASARFCFGDTCDETGSVTGVGPPDAPFVVMGMHVDGPAGSRPVLPVDFPVALAAGEALVVDFQAIAVAPGEVQSQITWFTDGGDNGNGNNDDLVIGRRDSSCTTDLVASAPACRGPDAGNPCAAETCSGGACVPAPVSASCDDACQTGGTCVGGTCAGGVPISCDDGNTCTADACDPNLGCVHTPDASQCDDHDPCTVDTCDVLRGCVHVPQSGAACDDGDPCTTGDRCRGGVCTGTAMRCGDSSSCAGSHCVAGQCVAEPDDSRCDSGQCVQASCRPDDPAADRHGCVSRPVEDGEPCTDDGASCTDDVCTGGACLHVPVDTRCAPASSCVAMSCSPGRPGADTNGCVASGARAVDGGVCSEDGDPCSTDTCGAGTCRHQPIPDVATCIPIQPVFRQALGLVSLARGLRTTVVASPARTKGGGSGMDEVLGPLAHVQDDLGTAVDALAGRGAAAAAPQGTETVAQARARVALGELTRTPGQERALLGMLRTRRTRAALGAADARASRRRAAVLLHGTKSLKGALRGLQQVSRTFAR